MFSYYKTCISFFTFFLCNLYFKSVWWNNWKHTHLQRENCGSIFRQGEFLMDWILSIFFKFKISKKPKASVPLGLSSLYLSAFDASIGVKIPFFRVSATVEPGWFFHTVRCHHSLDTIIRLWKINLFLGHSKRWPC